MSQRGKLIALEGIDGSGKATQIALLAQALEARGLATLQISFPRYDSFFGKMVGRYLNGDFGTLETIDPHFSALLYAADRSAAKAEIHSALAAGKIVLADRYIGSNLAHQTARVSPEHRDEFIHWLENLEYGEHGLPKEDLVVYLHVPVSEAHRLIAGKPARSYTGLRRDIQEADVEHLARAADVYNRLATEANWVRIECTQSTGEMDSPLTIHRAVIAAVDARIITCSPATAT